MCNQSIQTGSGSYIIYRSRSCIYRARLSTPSHHPFATTTTRPRSWERSTCTRTGSRSSGGTTSRASTRPSASQAQWTSAEQKTCRPKIWTRSAAGWATEAGQSKTGRGRRSLTTTNKREYDDRKFWTELPLLRGPAGRLPVYKHKAAELVCTMRMNCPVCHLSIFRSCRRGKSKRDDEGCSSGRGCG